MQATFQKKIQAAQVYFPADMYLRLKRLAKNENKPLASWFRDLAAKELKKKEPKRMKLSDMPTFNWPDLDPYTSEKVDEIVYGNPHGLSSDEKA